MGSLQIAEARMNLLSYVADETGFETVEEMLAAGTYDGVCPGVCLRCKEIVDRLEPDGDCECPECHSDVKSVLLIAGLI